MSGLDKEKAKKNLKVILDRMRSDTDVVLLNKYHKLYRKEISFFKRSWAAAWLFMYYDQKETPGGYKKAPAHEDKSAGIDADNILPEEKSKRLFFSVGKNRRLYPRELIAFIISKTSASKEDIGIIRILDNYSFVQVRDTSADEIIEALNGIRFRGRTLAVNYAKSREQLAMNSDQTADGEE